MSRVMRRRRHSLCAPRRRPVDHRILTLGATVVLGLPPALVVLGLLGVDAPVARVAFGGLVMLVSGRLIASMLIPPPADDRAVYGPERLGPSTDAG